jgi:maltooligosyltrehalose trehalohydrolase
VGFIQTHDLIGNRIFGERIDRLAAPEAVRAAAAVYLLLPHIPMLFMGEEWGASTPFPYFSDYGGGLAEAVRRGRRQQLAQTNRIDEAILRRAPDPQAESTFLSAKLRWEELSDPPHAARLEWYRRILGVRRARIVPLLDSIESCGTRLVHSGGQFECAWELKTGGRLCLRANLCAAASNVFGPASPGEELWLEGSQPDPRTLGAWSVLWSAQPAR